MLHVIFQRHHITPDEIYNKPKGVKTFIYASEMVHQEEDERMRKRQRQEAGRRRSKGRRIRG